MTRLNFLFEILRGVKMSIDKAINIGNAGNEMSKKITGTSEVSAGRTVVAAGSGAALGGIAAGTVAVVGGVAAAPIAIPLAAVGAVAAGIFSLFD
jgi:hypothetical protein